MCALHKIVTLQLEILEAGWSDPFPETVDSKDLQKNTSKLMDTMVDDIEIYARTMSF